ncbi:MAG: hypothetical protein SAK29_09120 [Scytonema sp. PMC 1069.18]|nr:hypothetical protein [Scytonema sp. PMC 1069.18]MEC4881435.1 hypothetical protein [Scytonema sp. PMC 1070.18]
MKLLVQPSVQTRISATLQVKFSQAEDQLFFITSYIYIPRNIFNSLAVFNISISGMLYATDSY